MTIPLRTLFAGAVAAASLATATPILATTTDVVLDLEGNPTCSSLAENQSITESRDTSVQAGEEIMLSGPLGQSIEATVDAFGTSILEWTSTVPVNFVILKGQGNAGAIVYHFGTTGTTGDTFEDGPEGSTIQQAAWCYGLTDVVEQEPLPLCSEVEGAPECPVDDETMMERNGLLIFFDFDAANFAVDRNQCTCGDTILVDCDETASVEGENTCAGGELERTPVELLGFQNPASTVCTTISGKRVCKTTD